VRSRGGEQLVEGAPEGLEQIDFGRALDVPENPALVHVRELADAITQRSPGTHHQIARRPWESIAHHAKVHEHASLTEAGRQVGARLPGQDLGQPADNTEDTVMLVRVTGANVNFNEDGTFNSILDATALLFLTDVLAAGVDDKARYIRDGEASKQVTTAGDAPEVPAALAEALDRR
jgi:hypothetical protein